MMNTKFRFPNMRRASIRAAIFARGRSVRSSEALPCGVFALIVAVTFSFGAPRVLATASSSAQMRDTEKERAALLRARREIQAIYNAMAAAQKRGNLNAMMKFFAPDVQIVGDDGARLSLKDLRRVLALPAATMRLDIVNTSITGFARRGTLADAKVMTHIEATSKKSRNDKSQQFVIETLRRETWRKTRVGWRLILSKTLAQITRAK